METQGFVNIKTTSVVDACRKIIDKFEERRREDKAKLIEKVLSEFQPGWFARTFSRRMPMVTKEDVFAFLRSSHCPQDLAWEYYFAIDHKSDFEVSMRSLLKGAVAAVENSCEYMALDIDTMAKISKYM